MSHRIKLRQLRAYQAIMMSGSVSGAAERLHTTQPAISKHLAALEDAIGMRLFTRRRGGPMTPTRAGVKFYKAIEGTLWGVESIADVAREIVDHSRARLRIAATPPLINSQFLAGALARFKAENPNVRFFLEPRHRLEIEDWVVSRQADFGLALLPVENPLIVTRAIVTTRAVVVVHEDHRLSGVGSVSVEDLRDERLILPSRQPLRNRIEPLLADVEASFDVDIEASSAITCCKFAAAGFGVAICDPFSPTAFLGAGLRVLTMEPGVSLTYGALFSRDEDRRDIVDQVLRCMSDELTDRPVDGFA